MIYTVTMNPALDRTVEIPDFSVNQMNRIASSREDPGGKGINVARMLVTLGINCAAYGFLAGRTGKMIWDLLGESGVERKFLFVPGETRTNLKIIDPLYATNTEINEAGCEISEDDLNSCKRELLFVIAPGDVVIFSGSIPGHVSKKIYREWIQDCAKRGARTILDADGEALREGMKAKPFLIKPNLQELSNYIGRSLATREEILTAAIEMKSEGIENVVVSEGSEGAFFLLGKQSYYAHGVNVPVKSTVGAGDCMVAALAYSIVIGMKARDTVRLAMAAGAAKAMQSGSQPPTKEEVESLIPLVDIELL